MFTALILSVLLLWSVVVVAGKIMPKTTARCRKYLATLSQPRFPSLSNWLQPNVKTGCGGGCDCPVSSDSSSSPQKDASAPTTQVKQPVQWR